jgi:hypothetical protein
MKKNRIWLYALASALGAVSVYTGQYMLVEDKFKTLSGTLTGFGAAAFCLGLGNLVGALIISKTENEKMQYHKNIGVNDERNTQIRDKVGAKINQIIIYALSVIVLAMGFMHVNVAIIIMLSSVFVLELILTIALTNYYSNKL